MATLQELKDQKAFDRAVEKQRKGEKLPPALYEQLRQIAIKAGKLPPDPVPWDPKDNAPGWNDKGTLRGATREAWESKDFEILIHGPFETGKTFGLCKKLNAFLWKYAGAQWVMTRKTYSSLVQTAVQTYERVAGLKDPNCKITAYGGAKPEWYDYPNGSRLWIAGFDNPQKVLSGERDGFYINQAEDFALDEYETITGRATGRGAVMPYTQVLADANPGPASHWILSRPSIKLLKSYHEDNPTLWDYAPANVLENTEEWPDIAYNGRIGRWTEQGRRSLSVLDAFTGVRYQRYRLGNWCSAEGAVYENFDRDIHTIPSRPIPSDWRRIRVIDFGFENPFTCLWIAIDPDGRMYVYREIYVTHKLVSELARDIVDLSAGEHYEATICDHDAEDRATLQALGIKTVPAWKKVSPGIQCVQDRMKVQRDGLPRIMILRDSLCKLPSAGVQPDPLLVEKKKPVRTSEEFEVYVWAKDASGKPNKEEPVKEYDHGMDAIRYGAAFVDKLGRKIVRVLKW